MMTIAEFEDLLNRLGDDIPSWPASQQEAADLLLRTSDDARRLVDESRLLRRALSSPPILASAGLTNRIMQAVRAAEPSVDPDGPVPPPSSADPQSR
jgi:hypothetical protein